MSDGAKNRIAELQRAAAHPGDPTQQSVLIRAAVAAVLLEIAAAALVWRNGRLHDPFSDRTLVAALVKVRP